ncbi:MAG TPA: hypothetical protein VGJ44_18395, partial [Kribbellaceae bacterium]
MRHRPRALRHSLVVRLLAASVLVAVCSITATAWLAARTTSTTIRQELGDAVASDARTYQTLLTYAVEHRTWGGVAPALRNLAQQTGRRIVLTDERRRPIADSGGDADLGTLPRLPSGVVDPLAVDVTLITDAPADRIDRRVAGPFLLPTAERTRLASAREVFTQCGAAPETQLRFSNGGRPLVDAERAAAIAAGDPTSVDPTPSDPAAGPAPAAVGCAEAARVLTTATPTEAAALRQLSGIVNACLANQGQPTVPLVFNSTWQPAVALGRSSAAATSCLAAGRRDQLRAYVAPSAL